MTTITTIETIKSGKMQFNVKTAKDFRATLAKWHNADFELAEKILERNDRVRTIKDMMDTNTSDLEKIEKGENGVLRTKEVIEKENADFQSRIDVYNNELTEYRKAQEERYKGAHDLLTKDMYNAYVDFEKNGNRDGYILAFANFFQENGLEPAMASLDEFIASVGKKKNSSRQKVKDGKHNGVFSYNAWRDIFLGEICDVMGDALPLYKFTYVLKDKRAKKDA